MRLHTATLLVALAAAGSAWAASNAVPRTAPVHEVFQDLKGNWLASAWRDPDTGCQYLIRGDTMIPRLGKDGRPLCSQ